MLAENIAIREEAIHVKVEAEKWKAAHRLNKEVVRMKEQLEEKLSEVNALVGELGALPEKVARRSSQRRRKDGFVSDLVRTTEDREPRHRQTILEQEGRLPAILEDKYYPRRTLEAKEIHALKGDAHDDATESPDLGPPPVAHFDEAEAVTFDARRSPRRTSTELIEESERSTRPSNTGVENRRKRRTSTLLQSSDLNTTTMLEPEVAEETAPEPEEEPLKKVVPAQPQSILKTGAKRKLGVSELEDTSRVSKELDDFIFQRRAAVPAATIKPSRFSRPTRQQNQEDEEDVKDAESHLLERPAQPARKILAPKSTNSPTKRRVGSSFDKSDADKDEDKAVKPEKRIVSRVRARPTITEIPPAVKLTADEDPSDGLNDKQQARMAPKTPAAELDNILSPISTEPSTKHQPPKEMAITNSVEDVLNGSIGRNSRRAKAAVSYAEPNLRDKMRRPGKALVSAVEGLSKSQYDGDISQARTVNGDTGTESARQNREPVNHIGMKEDRGVGKEQELSSWQDRAQNGKSEPASPLRGKVAPATRFCDRHEDELSKAVSRLSMFEPRSSSPVAVEHANAVPDIAPHSKSKRHPVQLSSTQQSAPQPRPSSAASRARRPSSVSEVRPAESDSGQSNTAAHVKRSASVSTLPTVSQLSSRATSRTRLAAAVDQSAMDADDQGGQRSRSSALSRRRSMMV